MLMTEEVTTAQEYDDMSSEEQGLYDEITEMFGDKWTHEQTLNFMGELADYGVTEADTMRDAFMYVTDCQYTKDGAKAEFAEYFHCECLGEAYAYEKVVVDWAATYDYALRFDMFIIEFDGDFYFFNSNH